MSRGSVRERNDRCLPVDTRAIIPAGADSLTEELDPKKVLKMEWRPQASAAGLDSWPFSNSRKLRSTGRKQSISQGPRVEYGGTMM